MFTVTLLYAPNTAQQDYTTLSVEPGSTIQQVINQSGLLLKYPDIHLDKQNVGIFSQIVTLNTPVNDGDRIEIYRPLHIDPKKARSERAIKTAQQKKIDRNNKFL